MFNLEGKKSVDIGFTAAGEKAGLKPRASLEKDWCNVSTDANPRSGNEVLKELERRDLCMSVQAALCVTNTSVLCLPFMQCD